MVVDVGHGYHLCGESRRWRQIADFLVVEGIANAESVDRYRALADLADRAAEDAFAAAAAQMSGNEDRVSYLLAASRISFSEYLRAAQREPCGYPDELCARLQKAVQK